MTVLLRSFAGFILYGFTSQSEEGEQMDPDEQTLFGEIGEEALIKTSVKSGEITRVI